MLVLWIAAVLKMDVCLNGKKPMMVTYVPLTNVMKMVLLLIPLLTAMMIMNVPLMIAVKILVSALIKKLTVMIIMLVPVTVAVNKLDANTLL